MDVSGPEEQEAGLRVACVMQTFIRVLPKWWAFPDWFSSLVTSGRWVRGAVMLGAALVVS